MFSIALAVDRIRAWIATTNRRPATFARHVGLHPNTLRGIFEPDWNPRLKTLLACDADVPADFLPSNEDGQAGMADAAEKVRQAGGAP